PDKDTETVGEKAMGDLDLVVAGVVDGEMQPVAVPPSRLSEAVDSDGDQYAGGADDQERRSPPEGGPDEAAEAEAQPEPDEHEGLLNRERRAALVWRVVVGEQAAGRRLGDGLAESQR